MSIKGSYLVNGDRVTTLRGEHVENTIAEGVISAMEAAMSSEFFRFITDDEGEVMWNAKSRHILDRSSKRVKMVAVKWEEALAYPSHFIDDELEVSAIVWVRTDEEDIFRVVIREKGSNALARSRKSKDKGDEPKSESGKIMPF
jgi:hypothetical protein